jgi:hypothetical protein
VCGAPYVLSAPSALKSVVVCFPGGRFIRVLAVMQTFGKTSMQFGAVRL